jgi:hypothetical protein
MLLREPLEFAKEFIEQLNGALVAEGTGKPLSRHQKWWLAFCITAVLITNSVCWSRFEKVSLGKLTLASVSWMFRCSGIGWERLLVNSVKVLLNVYGITEGVLALDDSDRARSKHTTQIAPIHKLKDKKTQGYVKGQTLVFLLLVSSKITVPVGFAFYQPDPVWSAWELENRRLKKAGVAKKERPKKPPRDARYPTKQALGLNLLREFKQEFPGFKVKCILADALYGTKLFMEGASELFGGVQVISQLKGNQLVHALGRKRTVKDYFRAYPGIPAILAIRGGESKAVVLGGARLWVKAHQAKRFVVALRYEGEEEPRYLVATDVSWRMTDIAFAYTMRWLVEVFFSDWKSYEGWCQMAKQPGVEGSCRGVILSLLTDHALLLHPDQTALIKRKLPASTVGSLRDKIRFDAIIEFIRQLVDCADPTTAVEECLVAIKQVVVLSPSSKHLSHRTLGRLEPTPSLKYKKAA